MGKPTSEMTTTGKIRTLRIALRRAGHPKVDEYDGTYLLYVADFYNTIDEAVAGLLEIDSK